MYDRLDVEYGTRSEPTTGSNWSGDDSLVGVEVDRLFQQLVGDARHLLGPHRSLFARRKNTGRGKTTVQTRDGEMFVFDTCWRPPGVGLATVGGFISGLISAGLPEVTTTQLVVRCRLPPRVAVATSVFVLAIAAIAGAVVHAPAATPVWYIVDWSIPGVIIGGTVGTRVGKYVPSEIMEPVLGAVFAVVGSIVLGTELLG